jgi:PAS domain S-box-containing protein
VPESEHAPESERRKGSERDREWPPQELHPDAYRQLVEGAPAILYIDRPDELSTNLYTSPQIVDLLGYSVREWMEDAELWVRSIHPDDRERVVREHRATNARGERFLAEYRLLSKAGREVWIRDEAVPVRTEDGAVVFWRGVMTDITAQKHAEERLRSSLEEVRRMVAQRRELAQLIETAQEEERRRIAADIHDDPIQVMSAVDMRLQLLLARPDRVDAHEIGELAEELRSAIDRLRNLLFELRPVTLDLEGLTPAIAMYLEHAAKETGWSWEVIDELDEEPADEARVSFYRIAQEAVTNVRKHANATHVDVRLTSMDSGLLLRVADDGDGFEWPDTTEPGHIGLATVTERAELAGGWCEIRSTPGEGTTVECWMPVDAPAEQP